MQVFLGFGFETTVLLLSEPSELCAGGEGRRGNNVGFSLKKLGCSSKKFRPYLPCEAGRWRRTGICTARFDFRGNSAEQAKEEDASTLSEMSALVDDLSKLTEVVNEANKGIGADVRNRVDVLYNRATLLKYSADRMVDGGGRVPVQLSATLKVFTVPSFGLRCLFNARYFFAL